MTQKKRGNFADDLIAVLDEGLGGVKALLSSSKSPSPEEKLLMRRDKKRRRLQKHRRAYIFVNLFLILVNVLTWDTQDPIPWVLFVLGGWGIGLGMHWLGFRDWVTENQKALERAETVLRVGVAGPGDTGKSLSVGSADPEDLKWERLLVRATELLAVAEKSLEHLGESGQSARMMLRAGVEDVAKLGDGQRRLRQTLRDMGADDCRTNSEKEINELRTRLQSTSEERLRGLYQSNLALMEARQSKIAALHEDLDRIRASIEGFILAAENIRLDAVRIESGSEAPQAVRRLGEPLERMAREVYILREVEAELERM
ncbi:MAG: 2TM domain-containing protein [Myxococcales bacterium]|nr:2TM domain-containing protein [Myxococcales bacterium]